MSTPILDGVRVFDLSIVTAGAGGTQVLADFGAEVIKIESAGRPDLFRGWYNPKTGGGDLIGTGFRTVNRNKKGFGVDLKNPEGLEVAKKLIAECDVVVENFRQGVLERLGLGFDELVKIRPDIVLVSVASQGTTGPDAPYGSFGSPLDALGGSMSVTGYDENNPLWSSMQVNYPDQTAALLGPAMIAFGILSAKATGKPRWIDISQRELVTALLPEAVLCTSLGRPAPTPTANRGYAGLEWATPCSGDDEWLAVSLDRSQDRATISGVVGNPGLAEESDEALVKGVAAWSQTLSRAEAAAALQGAGLAAAAVMRGYELHDDPYFREIGYFLPVENPEAGGTELQRGRIVRFDDLEATDQAVDRAPRIGEHTAKYMTDLLGMSPSEVHRLHTQGAI
ncbi:CaiB/BaiF CoA transferase family protein, partial [Rhodococcus koreensis]